MINSVSRVHMVCLATIHYLHHGCLRVSASLFLFLPLDSRGFRPILGALRCPRPRRFAVTLRPVWSGLSLSPPRPPRRPLQLSVCGGALSTLPASELPHMPFPLVAMLFPHFPPGPLLILLVSGGSPPQGGLRRPFSKSSCIPTTSTSPTSCFPICKMGLY